MNYLNDSKAIIPVNMYPGILNCKLFTFKPFSLSHSSLTLQTEQQGSSKRYVGICRWGAFPHSAFQDATMHGILLPTCSWVNMISGKGGERGIFIIITLYNIKGELKPHHDYTIPTSTDHETDMRCIVTRFTLVKIFSNKIHVVYSLYCRGTTHQSRLTLSYF